MRYPRTREDRTHEIVTLAAQGMKWRAIARALRIGRNTVRRSMEAHDQAREVGRSALLKTPTRVPRPKKIDAFEPKVSELLGRFPDITAQRVFEELRDAGFTGGYTGVKEYMRTARPRPAVTPSLPTPVYGPGEMAESDWSPHVIDFTVAGRQKVQIFSYVLCHSRRKCWGAFERADLHALEDAHEQSFARLEAVAQACKYDSQKAVVLAWEGGQPIFNPQFLAYAAHYEFRLVACRRRKPNDKPQVERAFWGWERSFLNGRSFRDLADLRVQLAHWERTVHDLRPHKKTRRTPLEMFRAEERDRMLPLPRHPYDTARVVYRVCTIDGFICWETNRVGIFFPTQYPALSTGRGVLSAVLGRPMRRGRR